MYSNYYTVAHAHIPFCACVQCQYKMAELSLHVDLSRSILEDIVEQLQHPFTGDRTLEGLLLLETLLTYVVQIESLGATLHPTAMGALNDLIDATRELTQSAEELVDRQRRLHGQQLRRGRPKLQITEDQLRELLQAHFSVVSIAQLFSCSTKTIYRRLHEYNMVGVLQSDISDADLDGIVESFVQAHPTCGQRLLIGHLRSLNLHVQRQRVRESLLRARCCSAT